MKFSRNRFGLFSFIGLTALWAGCSASGGDDDVGNDSTAVGGSAAGGSASGGAMNTGGGQASGGAPATGGAGPLSGGGPGVGGNAGGVGGDGPTGGVDGGGGSDGAGGAGGAPGAGGMDSGLSGCTAADILCVDFEDTAVGSKPSGGPWDTDGCTDPNYSAEVTAGSGLNGSQGFVTSNAASSANTCALVHSLDGTDDFWVTLHMKIGGTDPDMEHEVTFFELGEALQDDPELRVGYRGDSSCGNMGQPYQGFELGATQSESGEFTGCTGSKTLEGTPVVDTWYCLETHVDQTTGSVVADLFIDGVDQSYLVHSNPEETVRGNFPVNYLKVGMQSYSGVFESLTIDDLSISSTRVGCD